MLSFIALVLPLCEWKGDFSKRLQTTRNLPETAPLPGTPRTYVPVDPSNPMPIPHPEQVTPIINLLAFGFLDPLIAKAWKVKTLAYEDLPPLTDYDRAEYLSKVNMEKLDPVLRKMKGKKERHLVWGLVDWLWRPYTFSGWT